MWIVDCGVRGVQCEVWSVDCARSRLPSMARRIWQRIREVTLRSVLLAVCTHTGKHCESRVPTETRPNQTLRKSRKSAEVCGNPRKFRRSFAEVAEVLRKFRGSLRKSRGSSRKFRGSSAEDRGSPAEVLRKLSRASKHVGLNGPRLV